MKLLIGTTTKPGYSDLRNKFYRGHSYAHSSKMNILTTDKFQKTAFKGTISKAQKTGEVLYNPFPKRLHNIVIEKTYSTNSTDHYKISNAHVFDHQIDTITKNSVAEFSLRDLKQDNELYFKWESPKFNLFPVGLYAALEKSCKDKSKLLIEVTTPKSLFKYTLKGFELSRKSYEFYELENGIQNKNATQLERIFNIEEIKEGRAKVYVELPLSKALTLKDKILNYLKININDNSIDQHALRKELLTIPQIGRYAISYNQQLELEEFNGFNSNSLLTIGRYKDKTKLINNNNNLNNPTLLNGKSLKPDKTINLHIGDNISIGQNVYMFVEKGLRQLSDNKETFFKLYPEGLNNIHFNQSAIADCYFLAALNSLMQTTEGQELIAHMTSESTQDHFKVRFPGFPEHLITVTPEEIQKLKGVKSNAPGIQVLETAFGKLRQELDWNEDSDNKFNGISKWLNWGWPDDALYILTGTKGDFLDSMDERNNRNTDALNPPFNYKINPYEEQFSLIECLLNKYANKQKRFIVTASTCKNNYTKAQMVDKGEKGILRKGHAVSIVDIDKTSRTITLADPGDTKTHHKIDYDYFLNYFNTISAVELPFKS